MGLLGAAWLGMLVASGLGGLTTVSHWAPGSLQCSRDIVWLAPRGGLALPARDIGSPADHRKGCVNLRLALNLATPGRRESLQGPAAVHGLLGPTELGSNFAGMMGLGR